VEQRVLPTTRRLVSGLLTTAGLLLSAPAFALNVQRLDPSEIDTLQAILTTLEPHLNAKKQDGTAILLSWEALYEPLDSGQGAFLDAFRALKAQTLGATSHYFGEMDEPPELVPVGVQQVPKNGTPTPLDPQYLPRPVFDAYQRMMQAMRQDLGKQLLVESGYRSPAYQLYLFLYYMPKHDYSITETNKFVALPGHSEHGYPPRQAIDFINEEGINGEDHPEEFEALPEYAWLQQHAKEFGFVLSYPRDNPHNTAFEPWHWHYEAR
jgi:LAS superfamily LD-carboxypeptidase LdcB